MKTMTFVDSVTIYVRGGRGGNGSVSFRREKCVPFGGPDGGDGGKGGDVILVADREVDSLLPLFYEPYQIAEDGGHGSGKRSSGKDGADRVVRVPCGTEVWDTKTDSLLVDLVEHGQSFIAARGGKGGLGNWHWKSSTNRAPREHTDGESGEEFTLRLIFKMVADVGLVGYPNAGKSSLLSVISDARPKIASYPFTTLHPVVGTILFDDLSSVRVVDVPGLIEGAHKGIGLGDYFLRHIERAKCVVYVVDMAGSEGRKPWDDYKCLVEELKQYRADLIERPFVIAGNKMDLPEAVANLEQFEKVTGIMPVPISALTGEGVDKLKSRIHDLFFSHRSDNFAFTS